MPPILTNIIMQISHVRVYGKWKLKGSPPLYSSYLCIYFISPLFGLISHKVVSQMGKKLIILQVVFCGKSTYWMNSNMQINRMAGRNDAYWPTSEFVLPEHKWYLAKKAWGKGEIKSSSFAFYIFHVTVITQKNVNCLILFLSHCLTVLLFLKLLAGLLSIGVPEFKLQLMWQMLWYWLVIPNNFEISLWLSYRFDD